MVDECVNILEDLVNMKKKTEASQEKKKSFYDNWLKLANIEGFNEKTERYLSEGFSFCGAKPFKQYMSQSSEPEVLMDKFFNGKLYGKDIGITFRQVSNLLALFLNDGNNANILSKLIEKFPIACQNKEGKQIGTASKTMEKYFFEELKPNVKFIPIAELPISSESKNTFVNLMFKFIAQMEKDGIVNKNILQVKNWLEDYQKNNVTKNPVSPNQNNPIKPSTMLSNALSAIVKMENENEKYKEEIARIKKKFFEEQEKSKFNYQRVEELTKDINAIKSELAAKNELLDRKEIEIADQIEMANTLEKEQSHQAEVVIRKIASQLKIEHQNLQMVLNIPMTSDLGESLRSQVKRIFAILERSGMKFN